MSRTILTFRLAHADIRHALVHEFSLHDGVRVLDCGPDERTIRIETFNAPAALWDVRATVGMFDDAATEVPDAH